MFEWDAGPGGYAVGPQGEFYGFEPEPGAAIQTERANPNGLVRHYSATCRPERFALNYKLRVRW